MPQQESLIIKAVILGAGVFSWYSLHDKFSNNLPVSSELLNPKQLFWAERSGRYILIIFLVGLITALAAVWAFSFGEHVILFACLLLSVVYSFALNSIRDKKVLFIVKPVLLALIWTIATSLPWIIHFMQAPGYYLALLVFRVFFMLILCLPFELKDIAVDSIKLHGNILNFTDTRHLMVLVLLATLAGLAALVGASGVNLQIENIIICLGIHFLLSAALALYTIKKPHIYNNYILLDLQIILQTLIVWIVH